MTDTPKVSIPNYTDSFVTQEIEKSFTYHRPNDSQIPRYEVLRQASKNLALLITELVPPGRERSTAITKLEESTMWANKGIACGEAKHP